MSGKPLCWDGRDLEIHLLPRLLVNILWEVAVMVAERLALCLYREGTDLAARVLTYTQPR